MFDFHATNIAIFSVDVVAGTWTGRGVSSVQRLSPNVYVVTLEDEIGQLAEVAIVGVDFYALIAPGVLQVTLPEPRNFSVHVARTLGLGSNVVGGGGPIPPQAGAVAPIILGRQSSSAGTFERIGTASFAMPGLNANFSAFLWTSDPLNAAEVRLFNIDAAAPVAGSTLSSASTVGGTLSAAVVLPAALTNYELQIRLSVADPNARASCTNAKVEAV